MRVFNLLMAMAVLSGCSGLNSDETVFADDGQQSSAQRTTANSPVLVYFPRSNELIPLESVLYGELGNNASTPHNRGSFGHHNAIDTDANAEPKSHEDVRTNLFRLSGLETHHPNWIFDSAPPAAQISGLSTSRQLRTPQKIVNFPEETVASIVVTKQGFGRCRYDQAKRKDVFEQGINWIHLLCTLSTP